MDNLLQKFRAPIISFCIGVLFSATIFWVYLEKNSIAQEDSIVIQSSSSGDLLDDNEVNGLRDVYVGGAVKESKFCKIDLGQSIFEQIETCVEFSGVDTNALRSSLIMPKDFSNDNSLIFITPKSYVESEVEGVSTSNDVVVGGCVNINSSTIGELDSLPGIGATYAQRIIDNRPYSSKTDLKKVKGIGDKTFSKLESLICL